MSAIAEPAPKRYTYADLLDFPEDNVRREIIDGRLFVSPSPTTRHQRTVGHLFVLLFHYAEEHGGQAYHGPVDVLFNEHNTVAPDCLLIRHDHLDRVEERYLRGAADLVVEVSSPSTRRRDLREKLALYERFGVANYWFVDLKKDEVLVYVLDGDRYGSTEIKVAGDTLEASGLPGLAVPAAKVLQA